MDEWMHAWIDEWMDVDEWMEGMDERMEEWTTGWIG